MENAPSYIPTSLGLPIAQSPFQFNGAKLSIFFLECEDEALQNQLDTNINQVSNGEHNYKTLSINNKSVLLMIMADMSFVASDQSGTPYGTIAYPECSFWIPAFDTKTLEPGLFLPLLLLDNGTAIASGREMYGFEKQQAQFQFLNDTGEFDVKQPNFTALPYSFKTLSAQTKGQFNPLFTLSGSHHKHQAESLIDHSLFSSELGKYLFDQPFKVSDSHHTISFEDFLKVNLPCIFLKQFPSIQDGAIACFQKVAHAPFTLDSINGGGLYWQLLPPSITKFQLQIFPVESHPIVEQFGLIAEPQDDGSYLMDTKGFWVDIDFTLQLGA